MSPPAIANVFADLPDPRRQTKNKLHRLSDILVIATCAVIGGAEIIALALPIADRIELTEIDADVPGDTFLPPLGQGWRETFRESHEPSGEKPGFAFVTLARAL